MRRDRIEPIGILHTVQLDASLVPCTPPSTLVEVELSRPAHIFDNPHNHIVPV
jgi:hypothetical protein